MTTMDNAPTIREIIAFRMARKRQRSMAEKAHFHNTVTAVIGYVMRFLLHVGAFGCLTMAGFSWTITAGWVTAGLSGLMLSWLLFPEPKTENSEQNQGAQTGVRAPLR